MNGHLYTVWAQMRRQAFGDHRLGAIVEHHSTGKT